MISDISIYRVYQLILALETKLTDDIDISTLNIGDISDISAQGHQAKQDGIER